MHFSVYTKKDAYKNIFNLAVRKKRFCSADMNPCLLRRYTRILYNANNITRINKGKRLINLLECKNTEELV